MFNFSLVLIAYYIYFISFRWSYCTSLYSRKSKCLEEEMERSNKKRQQQIHFEKHERWMADQLYSFSLMLLIICIKLDFPSTSITYQCSHYFHLSHYWSTSCQISQLRVRSHLLLYFLHFIFAFHSCPFTFTLIWLNLLILPVWANFYDLS